MDRASAAGAFAKIKALTMLYLVATVATLVLVVVARNDHGLVNANVWTHAVIVVGFALLLVVATSRAAHGRARAYLRLRIVSIVIPVVSVVLVALPDLFPGWMRIEQAAYAVLLLAVALLANSSQVRAAFGRTA